MDVGKRIVELREEKGWSQYRLHKESGVQQPTLRRYELGENIPGTEMLQKIATALGVSMAEFDNKKATPEMVVAEVERRRPPAKDAEEAYGNYLWDNLSQEQKEKELLPLIKSATVQNGKVAYTRIEDEELLRMIDKLNRLPPEARKKLSDFLDAVLPRRK